MSNLFGNIESVQKGSQLSYGVDEAGKFYVYDNTRNKMIWYGDEKGGKSLVMGMAGSGEARSVKDEGDRRPVDNGGNNGGNQNQPQGGGAYYGGGGYNAQAAQEAQQKRFYQSLLNALPGRQREAQGLIDQKYSDSFNNLVKQRDTANQNLDREQAKLNKQRANAYGQIRNDSQNMLQGLNNQLGMIGASNSSAAQMGAIATAEMANKQSSQLTDDFNDQMSEIAATRKKTDDEFENQNNQLNSWKKEQTQANEAKFTDLANEYRSKIGGEANMNAVVQSFRDMKPSSEIKVDTLPEYKAEGLNKVNIESPANSSPSLTPNQAQQYFIDTATLNRKKKDSEYNLN